MKIEDMPKDFTGNCWLHAADGTVLMSYTNLDRDTGRRRFYSFITIESPMSNHSLEPFKQWSKFEFPTLESKSMAETIQRLHERIEENRKDLLAKDDELSLLKIQRDDLLKNKKQMESNDLDSEILLNEFQSQIAELVESNERLKADLSMLRGVVKVFIRLWNDRERQDETSNSKEEV